MNYQPDNWVLLKIKNPKYPHYKILGGWSGGYLSSDSWRLNSGVVRHEETDDYYLFYGSSGSCYKCDKSQRKIRNNLAGTLNYLVTNEVAELVGVDIVKDFDWILNDTTKT